MKKVVLTYAPSEQQFLPVPPLGISVLSQYLIERGIENDIIDLELELWLNQGCKSSEYASKAIEELEIDKLPVENLVDKLKSYEIVTFSLMGKRQIPYLLAIIKQLKKHNTKLKYTIVGGAFFNVFNAKDIVSEWKGLVDYAIVGEGWQPLYELISNLLNDKKSYDVKGVACINDNDEVVCNANSVWEGELPIPNYKDINLNGYIKQQEELYGFKDKNIVYHVLVGDCHCPYNCSFCRISNNTKKVKTPTEIANEMIELNRIARAERFSLVCNEMNPTESYLHEFMDKLLENNKKLDWFCYFRPNKLSLGTLQKARKAGCTLIRYGVETGSQKILDHMNKKLYVDEIEQIMKDTHTAGIWNHINIVTGYLHETEKDIQLTLDFIERNKYYIDSIRVNSFYLPINSPIYQNPEKFSIKIIKNTGSYVQFEEPGCTWEEKQKRIQKATARILTKCMDCGINFTGILPFLVSAAVSHFNTVDAAKKWMKERHGYLWQPVSPDTAKWRLAHPDRADVMINRWEEIAGKRGSNYQTLMGMNNNEEDSY